MSKKFKVSSVALVSVFAMFSFINPVFAATPDVSSNVSSVVSYLESQQESSGKIPGFGGETAWTTIGFAAAGIDPHTIQRDSNSLVDFLRNNQPDSGASAATWEREILAITAAGENPFTFGGTNYVSSLQSLVTNNQIGSDTLVNDDIFGVLALISAGPSANQQIISDSIDFIIANQNPDGGFSWSTTGGSDTNDTAVAMMALNAAKITGFINTGLDDALSDAKSYLLAAQNPDGGWPYSPGGTSDGSSTAWGVQAMLGDDAVVSAGLTFLTTLQNPDGSVSWMSGFPGDTFTSSYALGAFAQKSFPVGVFEDEFQEEPGEEPTDETIGPGQDTQQEETTVPSDEEGKVLSVVDTKEEGKILAAVLPNTGIDSAIPVFDKTIGEVSTTQSRTLNLTFIIGVSLILGGIVLNYVSRRYLENNVD